MFEFEIIATGYTVVVATTTAMICKCINRRHIKKINNELNALKKIVMNNESEIKRLKLEKSPSSKDIYHQI